MFSRFDFTYDPERDVYVCPNHRLLRTTGTVHDGRVRNYLSQSSECRTCELKERCTRAPFRKIARDINEEARDHARALVGTPSQGADERDTFFNSIDPKQTFGSVLAFAIIAFP